MVKTKPKMKLPPPADPVEQEVRDALDRLLRGSPEHPKNRDQISKQMRRHGEVRINMRMLCRECGYSPTTIYKKFPWVTARVREERSADAPAVFAASDSETIKQQAADIRTLKLKLAIIRAETHQLQQANIELEQKISGVESARQASVNSRRKRKLPPSDSNVTPFGARPGDN